MKTDRNLLRTRHGVCLEGGIASLVLLVMSARAQLTPAEISDLKNMVGNNIEAATILGGDFGISGASFTGDNGSTINLQKFGGSGVVGDPKQMWDWPIAWQPQVQGSMGYLSSKRDFNSGALVGANSKDHSFSIQFGGGARFWFNDNFSIAPTIMGMYGHTDNTFYPNDNVFAQMNQPAAKT